MCLIYEKSFQYTEYLSMDGNYRLSNNCVMRAQFFGTDSEISNRISVHATSQRLLTHRQASRKAEHDKVLCLRHATIHIRGMILKFRQNSGQTSGEFEEECTSIKTKELRTI